MTHKQKRTTIWTLAITSAALFMVSLDNLVVTTAIPVIRRQLHASISQLEWTVNAYTLTFAVLLLTGAALGDRFGRRRLFVLGLLLFTGASAAAALATTPNGLDIARAVQGVGGAIVTPLTLTLLSAGVPKERRGLALGIWGGIGGLAIALGPLVGGAIVSGISWHWIFWLNVPIGLVLAPLALSRLEESRGTDSGLDLPGLALASSGLLGIVWGLIRGNAHGWTSLGIVGPIVGGVLLVAAFVAWELRTESPMLPMEFFRSRTFALTNVASLLMFFGMFGSIFLLAQFFQTVQGLSPLSVRAAHPALDGDADLRRSHRGRALRPDRRAAADDGRARAPGGRARSGSPRSARRRRRTRPRWRRSSLSGTGMALFFAPVANVVLSSVRPDQEGKASGAQNAIRELGGVFGVAVLASVFSSYGGYRTSVTFSNGLNAAVYLGAAVVALAALAAFFIPKRVKQEAGAEVLLPEYEAAA